MSKPLNPSDIELLINRQNTDDSYNSMTYYNSEESQNEERGSSASLISPEELGFKPSVLNTIDEVEEISNGSISLLHATDPCTSIELRRVLSPLPIFDNLSDDSDIDPDWAPESVVGRRTRYPLANECDSDENISQLTVRDLRFNRQLFLRRQRILLALDSDNSDNDESGVANTVTAAAPLPCTVKRNKEARVAGKSYLGYKKLDNKWTACVERPKRVLKPRCSHTSVAPKSKNSFLCALVTDEEREQIHKTFWELKSWPEKITFVKTLAVRRCIRRRRHSRHNTVGKKQSGHDIFINKMDAQCTKVRVCKLFFLNTLCIGEDSFRRWTKECDMVQENCNEGTSSNTSSCLRVIVKTGRNAELSKIVKTWLDILPKVPSHYCRSSSKKVYVESTFRSELHMHAVFKDWCTEKGYRAASRKTFSKVLTNNNIGIHHPRKDQCDTCCSYKTGNISQAEYDIHVAKKEEARNAKKIAIASANEKVVVVTIDVQSVLLAPKLLASALYYKLKLQCHNFTVYDVSSKNVTIYFWHEADGNVTANEFTSCLVDYCENLPTSVERIIIISDGCGHQNRNRILSSALSDLAQRKKVTIEQLYLEKGHTMMEVDSVHSTIEQYIKPPIYAPSDYIIRMRQARPQKPYDVKSIHYDFFLNFEELESNLKSIRPGKKKGDPVVVDIRGLQYLPDGTILYRLRHFAEWSLLQQRRSNQRNGFVSLNRLYAAPLKITESKFKHLQDLKMVIDQDYHPFYNNLQFNPGT
ncbi:unnamed protein product [Diatraea saccharalis]|uniref:Uncharacterized protein n=1 Tax=Diatraea saccharalis TaxID=40085 RepID=A0A9N9RBX4_9NEOP|nr:unnamed protein product [Diatraea saccharalis]